MLGLAIHIRAQIQHRGALAANIRQLRCDRGAVDALQRFQHIAGNRHQGAGIARRDGRVSQTVFHLRNRHAHGRVLLFAQRNFNRIVHADHLAGRHDPGARMRKALHGIGQTHQKQMSLGMCIQECAARRQS